MTTEELQALVASLAEQGRITGEALSSLRASAESQARSIESQARSIESLRETTSYNNQMMADAIELSAISQRTAAAAQQTAVAALELSANTARGIDRQRENIDRLENMIEILIRDNQADRARIRNLETDV
jgi:hypothetical protein